MADVHFDDLLGLQGTTYGPTEPLTIDQARVNLFADATGDHQWIHVDPERAASESPFGGPIAHGYLTMSLINYFLPQLLTVTGASMGVNVGMDKLRFPSPVPVGASVRATAEVVSVDKIGPAVQLVTRVTITVDGNEKPSCVADTVSRYFP